eukprot:4191760-Amphidinium_carterae.1
MFVSIDCKHQANKMGVSICCRCVLIESFLKVYANATLFYHRSAQLAFLLLGLANRLSAENHSAR